MKTQFPENINTNDDFLIEKLKNGDAWAYEQIFNKYWQKLLKYSILKLDSVELSKEIVQELFISLWERRESLNISNLENYLFAAAKYKIIKQLKTNLAFECINNENQYSNTDIYQKDLEIHELSELINKSIEKLSIKTKQIFLKSRNENMSQKSISKQLNISEKTVEYHISQALKFLRIELSEFLSIVFLVYNTQ